MFLGRDFPGILPRWGQSPGEDQAWSPGFILFQTALSTQLLVQTFQPFTTGKSCVPQHLLTGKQPVQLSATTFRGRLIHFPLQFFTFHRSSPSKDMQHTVKPPREGRRAGCRENHPPEALYQTPLPRHHTCLTPRNKQMRCCSCVKSAYWLPCERRVL